jgi:hypothetical protein
MTTLLYARPKANRGVRCCDESCHDAKNARSACTCICGGQFHGRGYARAHNALIDALGFIDFRPLLHAAGVEVIVRLPLPEAE